jgi:hypothetical protein
MGKISQAKRKDIFEKEIKDAKNNPPQGHYEPVNQNKGKSANIGLPRKQFFNSNPGPGAYHAENAL